MNWVSACILAYVFLQLLIGFAVARRIRNEEDYLLAGRGLGYVLTTFSVFATWFGAETCLGAAGAVYGGGLGASRADPFGYSLCLLMMGLLFALPLWKMRLMTLGDLFRLRFGASTERLAVLLMVPSSVLWAAAQIRAFGQIFATTSSMNVEIATLLAAAVVILYTVVGGLLADAFSDVVQGAVLIAGLLLLAFFVLTGSESISLAPALHPARLQLWAAGKGPWAMLESWALPILGSLSAQELIQRIIAAKSPQVARRSTLMAALLYFAIGLIPLGLGLLGPALVPDLQHPEQVLVAQASRFMPPFLFVLFAGALVSAILSTVDSTLLVAASLFGHNLLLPHLPGLGERAKLRVHRLCVVGFGAIALVLALSAQGVYALVLEASAFGTSGILVAMTMGLWRKKGSPLAANAALLGGMSSYALAAYVWKSEAPYLLSLASAALAFALGSGVARLRSYQSRSASGCHEEEGESEAALQRATSAAQVSRSA